jgi:hypothetical protein
MNHQMCNASPITRKVRSTRACNLQSAITMRQHCAVAPVRISKRCERAQRFAKRSSDRLGKGRLCARIDLLFTDEHEDINGGGAGLCSRLVGDG